MLFWYVGKCARGTKHEPNIKKPLHALSGTSNRKYGIRPFAETSKKYDEMICILMTPSEVAEDNWVNSFWAKKFWSDSFSYGDVMSGSWNVYNRAPARLYLGKTTSHRPPGMVAGRYILIGESSAADPRGVGKST